MLAKHVSTYKNIFCLSDTPLHEVFQLLCENGCGCVPIVESLAHKNLIGSVSEHDICLKTITDGLNPQRLNAGRVMNGKITTVGSEASVEECAELMKQKNVERLFVVDEDGAYAGIVTDKNLLKDDNAIAVRHLLNGVTVCPVISRELHLAY